MKTAVVFIMVAQGKGVLKGILITQPITRPVPNDSQTRALYLNTFYRPVEETASKSLIQ